VDVSCLELSFQPDIFINQLPKLIEGWDPPPGMPIPSRRLQQAINISMCEGEISASVALDEESIQTDLDSHANMIVVGKHCFIGIIQYCLHCR
jgi:hypothetical protein